MVLVQGGLFTYISRIITENGESSLSQYELKAWCRETFLLQLCHWLASTSYMINPFIWEEFHNPYNGHLWTLSVEFQSSLILFVVIIALARVRTTIRLTVVVTLMFSCSIYSRWDVALFLGGMCIAELNSFSGNVDPVNQKPIEARESKWKKIDRLLPAVVFIAGSYCASYPDRAGEETPGYRVLSAITPYTYPKKEEWWQSIGSIMIVWSATRSNHIR